MERRVHSFTFVIQLFLGLPRQHPSSAEPWRTVLEKIRKKSPTDEHGGVVVMESFFHDIFQKDVEQQIHHRAGLANAYYCTKEIS